MKVNKCKDHRVVVTDTINVVLSPQEAYTIALHVQRLHEGKTKTVTAQDDLFKLAVKLEACFYTLFE